MNAMRAIWAVALACACAQLAHAAPPQDFARRVEAARNQTYPHRKPANAHRARVNASIRPLTRGCLRSGRVLA